LERIGLINRVTDAVTEIVQGRRGLWTKGEAENGLAYFTGGLQRAKAVFTEVQALRDLYLMLLAEYSYVGQELASSSNEEKEARTTWRGLRGGAPRRGGSGRPAKRGWSEGETSPLLLSPLPCKSRSLVLG
jgi:hypothetical protein